MRVKIVVKGWRTPVAVENLPVLMAIHFEHHFLGLTGRLLKKCATLKEKSFQRNLFCGFALNFFLRYLHNNILGTESSSTSGISSEITNKLPLENTPNNPPEKSSAPEFSEKLKKFLDVYAKKIMLYVSLLSHELMDRTVHPKKVMVYDMLIKYTLLLKPYFKFPFYDTLCGSIYLSLASMIEHHQISSEIYRVKPLCDLALESLNRHTESPPEHQRLFNLSCVYSIFGNVEEATKNLEMAVQRGEVESLKDLDEEHDFDKVRNSQKFTEIREKLAKREQEEGEGEGEGEGGGGGEGEGGEGDLAMMGEIVDLVREALDREEDKEEGAEEDEDFYDEDSDTADMPSIDEW